jgi:ribosomal protein S18 acetylase RimI-like enzyme
MVRIRPARWPDERDAVIALFREYAAGVGSDLCFQGFERELSGLPGDYAPILLATDDDGAVGCVALRPLADGACEMKRLYVNPRARGRNLGRRLVEAACRAARAAGHVRICLDTLPAMAAVIRLYRDMGFNEIPPYGGNPPGVLCFGLDL